MPYEENRLDMNNACSLSESPTIHPGSRGDIKLANTFVTTDSTIAEIRDEQLTIPGSTVGTVAYMFSEQARGGCGQPAKGDCDANPLAKIATEGYLP
jgi:hypothetical protein